MNLIEQAFLLKKTPLFESLTLDELLTVSDALETLSYKKGQAIFQSDLESTRLFFIIDGEVAILDRTQQPLATLAPPDFFGEEGVFSNQPRAYSAMAKTPVEVMTLSNLHLLAIINQCPSIAINLLEIYTLNLDFRSRSPL